MTLACLREVCLDYAPAALMLAARLSEGNLLYHPTLLSAPSWDGSSEVVAEAVYLHIFIPLVREGPSRVLSELHMGVRVEEPTRPICPTKGSSTLAEEKVLMRGQVGGSSI